MRRQVFDQVEQVEWVDGECARGDRRRKRQTENMSTVEKEGAAGGQGGGSNIPQGREGETGGKG
eukprot:5005086-Alexandrium_andersonii.AAC.1